jgi:hypothetical protein
MGSILDAVRFETQTGVLEVSFEGRRTESRRLTCHAGLPFSSPSYRLLAIKT